MAQAAHAASYSLCVTDRAGVQPRPQTEPAITDCVAAIQPYVVIVCRFNGLLPFDDPGGMEV